MKITILNLLITMISSYSISFAQPELELKHRPYNDKWVYDYAGLLDEYSINRLNGYLSTFYKDNDIEFLALSVNTLNGEDINFWTNRVFANWKIGSKTSGQRGLLFVVAVKEKQVRLEVGYDLEVYFPDSFVGYIQNEQMKPFFEQGRIGAGIEATLELIIARADKYINTPSAGRTDSFSGGAGAKRDIEIGSKEKQIKPTIEVDLRQYFCAQDTPEKTFQLYLEASRRHIKEPDLGIYTDATKDFFRNWTVTNAQQDNERQFDNIPFKINIQGDYAVIYYPDKDRTFSPFFLKKDQQGWQLDFATMSKVISFNQHNFWRFVSREHPYMFAFKEYQIDENGFVWFKRTSGERGYINLAFPWGKVPMEIRLVYRGSSAERAGIKEGDIITHVNGQDVKELGFSAAVNECVGAIGEPLSLRIYRPTEKRSIDFTIIREKEIFD